MAPPISRRSKKNLPTSPPPPIPLPAIGLGLIAAIAAGFAASRALRRKRSVQSLRDEKQSIPQLLVQEREMETKEINESLNSSAILGNGNGTNTIAHELAFGAFEDVSLAQKRKAKLLREGRPEDEEGKGEIGDVENEQGGEAGKEEGELKGNNKKGGITEDGREMTDATVKIEPSAVVVEALQSKVVKEQVEEVEGEVEQQAEAEGGEAEKEEGEWKGNNKKGGITEDGREMTDATVKIEPSAVVVEAYMEALQSKVVKEQVEEVEGEVEQQAETEGNGEEAEVLDVNEDTNVDDEDNRGFADQEPAPILIDGRILDFFKDIPDFIDDPDVLSNRSNSLSDSVSECSMQEVSSAPVKPFVPTEETLETSWPRAKPELHSSLDILGQENIFSEDRNWSGANQKVPELAENLLQIDQNFNELQYNWANSNADTLHLKPSEHEVYVGLLNLKPVSVEAEEAETTVDEIHPTIPDVVDKEGNSVPPTGEASTDGNGSDDGISESAAINGKVLSHGSPPPEHLDDLESIGESEQVLPSTDNDSTGLTCKGESVIESVQINGKIILDDSFNGPVISEVMMAGEDELVLQSTDEDEHMLQPTREIADDFTSLTCKGENIMESVHIDDKVLLDESLNDLSMSNIMTPDEASSQTEHEETDGAISDVHDEPGLLASNDLSDNKTCANSEGAHYNDESMEEMTCLGFDALEKHVIVKGILEESTLQLAAAQTLDLTVGASIEKNVNLDQEQSSFFLASKGIVEADELSGKGSMNNIVFGTGKEGVSGGLSKQVSSDDRVYSKEQEIEEITSSCDPNDLTFAAKKLASLAESAHESYNNTREVDYWVSKGAAHHQGLQPKGEFWSKVLQYLPPEISLICVLIALMSSMLWYLVVSPLIHS